jgi:hypothetical protein
MRRILILSGIVTVLVQPIGAQIAVSDPANTARNSISATIKEYLIATQRSQREQMDRMSWRLSRLTNLRKYHCRTRRNGGFTISSTTGSVHWPATITRR